MSTIEITYISDEFDERRIWCIQLRMINYKNRKFVIYLSSWTQIIDKIDFTHNIELWDYVYRRRLEQNWRDKHTENGKGKEVV